MHPIAESPVLLPTHEPLWDVLQEHFDEAAFGVEHQLRTLNSPEVNLEQLARYPEERLVAHIDALLVAGEASRTRVLAPVLEDPAPDEPEKVAAAALALIEAEPTCRTRAAAGAPGRGRAPGRRDGSEVGW